MIGQTQDAISEPFEKEPARFVARRAVFGLQLDDERLFDADEVDDERPQRMLAPETPLAKLPRTQQFPQTIRRFTVLAAAAGSGMPADRPTREETPEIAHDAKAPAGNAGSESARRMHDSPIAESPAYVELRADPRGNSPQGIRRGPTPEAFQLMPSRTLNLYERLARRPLGKWLFAEIICLNAPYFSTIQPRFNELRPGYCQVSMRKRRSVLNHIRTVHALAIGNLCELAAGMMMEATLPPDLRWIPRGMTIEYLHKAKTDVTAIARLDKTGWSAGENVGVPVTAVDKDGQEVVRAVITMYISRRSANGPPPDASAAG
jgi:acyl-coenzyme A thioesterase PaaI-like protein